MPAALDTITLQPPAEIHFPGLRLAPLSAGGTIRTGTSAPSGKAWRDRFTHNIKRKYDHL